MAKNSNDVDARNTHAVGQFVRISSILAPIRGEFTPPGLPASLKGGV